jgi:hypothetical protein
VKRGRQAQGKDQSAYVGGFHGSYLEREMQVFQS